ncbi:MAG: fatty acid desaturase [Lewinellaceae bacterium]|nr:fatty acid desaturase [Lewinellaceae bacterium]
MKAQNIQHDLQNWRAIVVPYQQPDTGRAVRQLISSFLPFPILWAAMYFSLHWSYAITLLLACVAAFFLVRIFIIQHDCGHQSFLKSRHWNNLLGYFSSFFSSIPYTYWAKVHNAHHGHNGQLEHRGIGDIHFLTVEEYHRRSALGKLSYRLLRTPVFQFMIAPVLYLLVSNRLPMFRVKTWSRAHWPQVLNNLSILVVYGLLALVLGWKQFLLVHLPVLFLFGMIAYWFFYVQHQHEHNYQQPKANWDFLQASIQGSTYYKLPRLFQWLSGNIGFHHIHHLSSSIPNYHLEKCAVENPVLSRYANTLTFRQSLKCVGHKLWDEKQQRMISFREYRERGQAARP